VQIKPRSVAGALAAGRLLALVLTLMAPAAAWARMAVAPAAQPALFDKIFGYDRALGDRSRLQVLLVGGEGDAADLAQLETGFRQLGIRAEQVAAAAVGERLGPGVVVYLTAETATPAMLDQLAAARVLSIGGDPALAESGRAAVALGDNAGKPEIVVNLDRVATEGHDFPAQMLKVARVVRGAGQPAMAVAIQPPVLITLQKPTYPVVARRMGIQGDVVMRVQVDAAGSVVGVELVQGVSKTAGIDDVALRAARTAKFKPATQGGRPVPASYTLTLPFRL
jgi:TonB family protein